MKITRAMNMLFYNVLLKLNALKALANQLMKLFELRKVCNELEKKNTEVSFQKEELSKAYRKITDSINYAGRIQDAVLPDTGDLERIVKDYFIFFNPGM